MKDSSQPEIFSTCRHPLLPSLKRITVWTAILILFQHIFIPFLDNGQTATHIFFRKPASTIITLPGALPTEEIKTKTIHEPPPAPTARLTKGECLLDYLMIKAANETEEIKAKTIHEPPPAPTVRLTKGECLLDNLMIKVANETEAIKAKTTHKPRPAATVRLTKGDHLFDPLIIKAANAHKVDPALIKAVIMAESGYNPKALSKKGAGGLMQLMPSTAEALGVEDIFDPEHNINAGVIYLKRLMAIFKGDIKLALAAYNAGVRKVKMYQGIPPFKATQFYINKVFKYYEHYRQQMAPDLEPY